MGEGLIIISVKNAKCKVNCKLKKVDIKDIAMLIATTNQTNHFLQEKYNKLSKLIKGG